LAGRYTGKASARGRSASGGKALHSKGDNKKFDFKGIKDILKVNWIVTHPAKERDSFDN